MWTAPVAACRDTKENDALAAMCKLLDSANKTTFQGENAPSEATRIGLSSLCAPNDFVVWGVNMAAILAPLCDRVLGEAKHKEVPASEGELSRGQAVVLLKFLRAARLNEVFAISMLLETLVWRHEQKLGEITTLEEQKEFSHVGKVIGTDRAKRPVVYCLYGELRVEAMAATEDSQAAFVRWRMQFMERATLQLDLNNMCRDGANEPPAEILTVHDYANATVAARNTARGASSQIVKLLARHYPGLQGPKIMVNMAAPAVAAMRLASYVAPSGSIPLVANSSQTRAALLDLVPPASLPWRYGGTADAPESVPCPPHDSEWQTVVVPAGSKHEHKYAAASKAQQAHALVVAHDFDIDATLCWFDSSSKSIQNERAQRCILAFASDDNSDGASLLLTLDNTYSRFRSKTVSFVTWSRDAN